jgi:peptide/nickel transport system permease protein
MFITLVRMALLLFGTSLVAFVLISNAPVDPMESFAPSERNVSQEQREHIAEYWGLNKPPVERYFSWLGNVLRGDMGTSSSFRKPVSAVIAERFTGSLVLMLTAWAFSGVLGFTLGVICGANPNGVADRIIRTFSFILASTPVFWIGLLLLMGLSIRLGWFPLGLAVPIGKAASEVTLGDRIHHLILPAFTLSITGIASITLHTREKLVEVMNSDYVTFARARGESRAVSILRHGLRNCAIPAITLQFASFSELFGGSVLAENVFSYPGLGSAVSRAGINGDVPLILGVTMFSVLFVFVGNLIANLLYSLLNPQIRGEGRLS